MQVVLDAAKADAEAARRELSDDAAVILEQIAAYREQAVKVTEAIGIAGMAEGFRGDADAQKTTADRLRSWALAALLGAVGLAMWAASASTGKRFDLGLFAARSVAAAAIGSIAAYLIIQSAHHRERKRRSRKQALEFASIDPYLSLLPDEMKFEVKKQLAETWFAQPLAPIDERGGAQAASIPVTEVISLLMKWGTSR